MNRLKPIPTGKKHSVLWIVDLSKPSETVFKQVEEFKANGSEIHILYVGDDVGYHPSWYGDFSPGHARQVHARSKAKTEERLDHLCSKYLDGCPYYIRHSSVEAPMKTVRTILKEEDIDMVLIPSSLQHQIDESIGALRVVE